jgi:putative transposase
MHIEAGNIYHIYNQGNNKTTLFYDDADYRLFLRLFKKIVYPKSKTLAYCLMPNHFHFQTYATDISAKLKRIGKVESCELSNAFRILQSTYAQYINDKFRRSGSLFRQKAKAKCGFDGDENYLLNIFQYIHQNPLKAGLVCRIEDWPYSSFPDYLNSNKDSICDMELAEKLIGYKRSDLISKSYLLIDESDIQNIFIKQDFAQING